MTELAPATQQEKARGLSPGLVKKQLSSAFASGKSAPAG